MPNAHTFLRRAKWCEDRASKTPNCDAASIFRDVAREWRNLAQLARMVGDRTIAARLVSRD